MRQWCSAAALVFCATGAVAQQMPPPWSPVPLHISVRDISTRDGYLPDAGVEVTNEATGARVATTTGADGRVTVPVAPGSYKISISIPGFEALVKNSFCVVAGERAAFDVALRAGRRPVTPRSPDDGTRYRSTRPSVASQGVVSDDEMRDAVAYGRRNTNLGGYLLIGSRGLERWRLGYLFTPRLRIATMTQVADAMQKPFDPRELPSRFLERTAWIVATPQRHDVLWGDDTLRYIVAPSEVVIQRQVADGWADGVKPLWKAHLNTQCDASVFEAALGQKFPRPAIVAAFPVDAIQAGNRIAVTYSTTATHVDGTEAIKVKAATRRMTMSEEDLRKWR